jgi:hypothetical protein
VLGPAFDEEREKERLAEQAALEPEVEIDPFTGKPVDPNNQQQQQQAE